MKTEKQKVAGRSKGSSSCSKSTSRKKGTSRSRFRRDRPKINPDGTSSPKKPTGRRAWIVNRKTYQKYLDGLKSASDFMSEGKILFLYTAVRPYQRKAIYAKLKEVDPEGYVKLRVYAKRLRRQKRQEKLLPVKEQLAEGAVEMQLAVAQAHYESEGITKVRFVSADTIIGVIAHLLVAGWSRSEVCDELDLDPEIVNLVTSKHTEKAKRLMPQAILNAADRKVYRDLIQDGVTETTARADMIAARRRKIMLGAIEEGRKQDLSEKEKRDKESDQHQFFDVSPTEGEDDKEEKAKEDEKD